MLYSFLLTAAQVFRAPCTCLRYREDDNGDEDDGGGELSSQDGPLEDLKRISDSSWRMDSSITTSYGD